MLLLPHGYEGQGPEHSSARLERFLNLCADDNIQVCNLTTPAQLFHVLRRQVLRPWRKPLVVMTPKSLLRSPLAVSHARRPRERRLPAHHPGRRRSPPKKVKRVLLCSGKVYYELADARRELGAQRRRDRPPRAALPAARRADPRGARALHGRHAARLGAGRAVEHGRLVLHERAPAAACSKTASRSAACRAPRARARPPARSARTRSSRRA